MKISETLTKAKALIDAPEKWTQGTYARDEFGNAVLPESAEACRFCIVGAIHRVGDTIAGDRVAACDFIFQLTAPYGIVSFNDERTRTHAEVMQQMDRAIETAKRREEREDAACADHSLAP